MSLVKQSLLALSLVFLPAAAITTASLPAAQGGSGLCWVAPGASHDNGLVKVATSASTPVWVSVSPCSYSATDYVVPPMTIVDTYQGVPVGQPWNGVINNYGGAEVDIWMDEQATGFLELRGTGPIHFNGPTCAGGIGAGLPWDVKLEVFDGVCTMLYAQAGYLSLYGHALWGQWPTGSDPPPVSPFGTGTLHEVKPGETWDNGAVRVTSTNTDPNAPSAWVFPEYVTGQTHSWTIGTQTLVGIDQGLATYGGPYWDGTIEGVDRDDLVFIGHNNGSVHITGRGGWITMGHQTYVSVTCLPESPTSPNQGVHVEGPSGFGSADRWWMGPNSGGSLCLCD
jgi:hypothetical protein